MKKKMVLFFLGGLLVAVGLIYGFAGMLVPSIQERSGHIERWKGEIKEKLAEVKTAMDEADTLGKQPATHGDGPSPFERKLADVDYLQKNIESTVDMIEYEQGRMKEMSIITAAFVAAGLIAMLLGWRMRRKAT